MLARLLFISISIFHPLDFLPSLSLGLQSPFVFSTYTKPRHFPKRCDPFDFVSTFQRPKLALRLTSLRASGPLMTLIATSQEETVAWIEAILKLKAETGGGGALSWARAQSSLGTCVRRFSERVRESLTLPSPNPTRRETETIQVNWKRRNCFPFARLCWTLLESRCPPSSNLGPSSPKQAGEGHQSVHVDVLEDEAELLVADGGVPASGRIVPCDCHHGPARHCPELVL